MVAELKVGDTVRVRDPNVFVSAFGKKIANRDAVVTWVGPDKHGQFKGLAFVRFLKRDGRGKEFTERLELRDLVIAPKESP